MSAFLQSEHDYYFDHISFDDDHFVFGFTELMLKGPVNNFFSHAQGVFLDLTITRYVSKDDEVSWS